MAILELDKPNTPKSQILVGIPTWNDPTAMEAMETVGHISKTQSELFPPTIKMRLSEVNQQLHGLNVARKAKTIPRNIYNESKRVLIGRRNEYWKQIQKGGI